MTAAGTGAASAPLQLIRARLENSQQT